LVQRTAVVITNLCSSPYARSRRDRVFCVADAQLRFGKRGLCRSNGLRARRECPFSLTERARLHLPRSSLSKGGIKQLTTCGDEPKWVRPWFLGFGLGECRLLYLFSNAGTQTKPIRFSSKRGSGVGGKAYVEGCPIVGGGNVGVLFRPKRHAGMPLEQFGVTHVRPSWWPRRTQQTRFLEAKFPL
jgi:hypothetical protein